MQRRPLGRGRTLATIAGLAIVIGCILPWWTVGGTSGIPAVSGNGLEHIGIVVFLCGIVTLALVALPYAAGDRPLGLDRWLSFAMLAERSLRIRTSPDDSVEAPPYELTSMRSIRTGMSMARMRSAMNGSEPFRTDTRVRSRPA